MKYLILGSEGFVGKSLCEYLELQGNDVYHYDIKNGPKQDAGEGDLCLDKYDVIVFLAWDVGGANYLYREDTQFQQLHNNLRLLNNVFSQYEKIESLNTKMIFISTQLVDNAESVYGVTKKLGEVWCDLVGGLTLRLRNVYGPVEDDNERCHVISDFIRQAKTNGVIKMQTNGNEEREFVFIDDICRAIQYSVDNNIFGKYDVCNYEFIKILDVATIIGEELDADVIIGDVVGVGRTNLPIGILPDWSPTIDITQGLKYTIEKFI